MDVQSLIQEWRGRRVDFNHKATYLESDLLQEYLFECYGENVQIDTLRDLYEHIPESLTAKFYTTVDPSISEGDIVFINDFTHGGIATGEQDGSQFELLEQNAVGSQTGIGDDAIRTNYYPKEQICGQLRARFKAEYVAPTVSEPEPAPEPTAPKAVVQKPHKFATGGLKIPLKIEDDYARVKLPTYPSAMAAAAKDTNKAHDKLLERGNFQTDMAKYGMKRVYEPDSLQEHWINPSDNVIAPQPAVSIIPTTVTPPKPKLDGSIEAEANYLDFKTPDGKLQEKYYTAKEGGALVLDFKTGKQRRMPANAHIWLSGITGVGGIGYGVATKCIEHEPPLWIGVLLGELYEDDTFSKHTTLEERQVLRRLTISDHIELKKARLSKLIKDIL